MDTKRILLVEDNPSDIDLTHRAFGKAMILNPIDVAEDGQQALDYLFGDNPLPAIVLLDLNLPVIGGLDVLKEIRANPKTRRLPVVILTSSKEEEDMAQSYDLGVNSYVRKPVDFYRFAQAIQQLGIYWLIFNEPPPPVK